MSATDDRSCALNPTLHSDSVLVAASLTGLGWPVIPVWQDTRRPVGAGGPQHHRIWCTTVCEVLDTDEDLVGHASGPVSWALILGEPNADGWRPVVLDPDSAEAQARLVATIRDVGPEAQRWASATMASRASRGVHLFGVTQREVRTSRPWAGLDLKARGYVLLPGNFHPSGVCYSDVTSESVYTDGSNPGGLAVYRGVEVVDQAGPQVLWSRILPIPDELLDALVPAVRRTDPQPAPVPVEPEAVGTVGELSPAEARARLAGTWAWLRREAVVGDRNNELNKAAGLVAGLLVRVPEHQRVGDLAPERWRQELIAFALEIGLERWEVPSTVSSGWNYGSANPPADSRLVEIAPGVRVDADAEREFWTERWAHRVIRAWAHARMRSPYAVLVGVLARVLASVPPFVVLPPIIGGPASLNLLVALVGQTSGGKDRALDVAPEAVSVVGGMPYREPSIGTGEGLVSTFAHTEGKDKHTVMDHDAALIRVSEVDTWAQLVERKGANLESVVRSAFMSQQLGFGYRADPSTLAAHSYRLCLNVGVQPAHAGALLGQKAVTGGTAGRFLWVPAHTLDLPPVGVRPEEPPSWRVVLPPAITPPKLVLGDGLGYIPNSLARLVEAGQGYPSRVEIRVCEEAEAAVLADGRARTTGAAGIDPLGGYDLLIQEKIAFALSVLDGGGSDAPAAVGEDDWRLAGHVLDVSRGTRAATRREFGGAGQQQANHAALVAARAADSAAKANPVWQRCEKNVRHHLHDRGRMTESMLMEKLSSYQRELLPAVLEDLLGQGVLACDEGHDYWLL